MSLTLQTPRSIEHPASELVGVHRLRFSRAMYHAMSASLLANEGRHYELFNGDIIEQMPQNEPHATLVMRLLFALMAIFGQDYIRCQMPVVLANDTEPEPDVMITAVSSDVILASGSPPSAEQVHLVVEISVTTLEFDLGAKAIRYAQADIPEYWVLDVAGRALVVHRDPNAEGYTSITRLTETETVSPLAAPKATLNIARFLP